MSRLDDLIDLMQSACETYLINPSRNGRAAYIQVDNLCELAMKTWLYEDSKQRQKQCLVDLNAQKMATTAKQKGNLIGYFERKNSVAITISELGFTAQSTQAIEFNRITSLHNQPEPEEPLFDWQSHDPPTRPKSFHDVLREVEARHTQVTPHTATMQAALTRIQERRDKRNQFFHDPSLSGLTVSDEACQYAFLDFDCLAACLFPADYPDRIKSNPVVRAHLVILRLKHRSEHTRLATEFYRQSLLRYKSISVPAGEGIFEYHALYEDAGSFCDRIYERFYDSITKSENEIRRIEGMRRRTTEHDNNLRDHQKNVALLKEIIKECFD